jgi:beta-galactosidase
MRHERLRRESIHSHAADLAAGKSFPWLAEGLVFGGDYNPEQWPESLWPEDIELMTRAGVNVVNLGIFSWGLLEPRDGVFEWAWLDRIMGMLADAGIGVNLATPTAAPPMWLLDAHPEIATVDARGVRTSRGGRLAWSPSSGTFRDYALRMVRAIAERYARHPALRSWHVSNEIGNENAWCFSDETAQEWQRWLERTHGTIDALNAAWGTAFWGHTYGDFAQVMPPREVRTSHNPALRLDFERFTSDALLGHYVAERDVLRQITPDTPITTNFMIQRGPGAANYARWAREVDFVANDHYTTADHPQRHVELAFSADRARAVAAGEPWLLIEHSTAAVNWQPVNAAKVPGEMMRNTLSHIARGADGAMFFQWRQSARGSEQHHSAMVPHAGGDSTIYRDVERLGAALRALARIQGTRVEAARVAMIFDHDSASAWRSARTPSQSLDVLDLPLALYGLLLARGVNVDVLPAGADLTDYGVVLVPTQYLVTDADAAAIIRAAERGAHVLVSYFSGIVDHDNAVRLGGYPGAFRDLLGVRVDEFFPLLPDERILLDNGFAASTWTERVRVEDAEIIARLSSGPLAGSPAITRRVTGRGSAVYLSARVSDTDLDQLLETLLEEAAIAPIAVAERGMELSRREDGASRYLFAINHTDSDLTVEATGVDLLTGERLSAPATVPAGAVRVIEETS